MKARHLIVLAGMMVASPARARAEGPSSPPAAAAAPASVADLLAAHDRALIRDLRAYVAARPKADDLDQAYMTLFDKVIEHDWFREHEELSRRYLADFPDGPVRSLAQIVATMARAQDGQFDEALKQYRALMGGLGKADQEEFASQFSETLSQAAVGAGAYDAARQVYETLLERFGESPNLRQKVQGDLARLAMVGKPAPAVTVKDVKGETFRLEDLRGRYVLVDFWATWCSPCVAELPRLREAYARYRDSGLEIVGVSLDETKAAVLDLVRARNIPWRQIHNASCGGDLVEAFGVNAIPASFLIDPRGTIVRLELRGPALDRALGQLIKETAARPTAAPRR